MEIIEKSIKEIKPYEKNPRKNDEAVQYVMASIREFGFKVPIIIDKNNVVIAGHTRLESAKQLGMKKVPCIMADDLNEEQVKAFRLADNKVGEKAEWDFDLLQGELEDIISLDMEGFGFEFAEWSDHDENSAEIKERRTNIHNLNVANYNNDNGVAVGPYDIPKITPVMELPKIKEWIGFNYVMSDENPEGKAVHFFIDDYQFERVWNEPEKYLDKLRQYVCVLSPDFSPYGDMPMACQIFNHYRKHWVAKFWQDNGITVIPTIRASSDERSLDWYLDGEPKDGIVAISAMWTKSLEEKDYFQNKEYRRMIDTLNPKKIIVYGGDEKFVEGLDGDKEMVKTFSMKRWE